MQLIAYCEVHALLTCLSLSHLHAGRYQSKSNQIYSITKMHAYFRQYRNPTYITCGLLSPKKQSKIEKASHPINLYCAANQIGIRFTSMLCIFSHVYLYSLPRQIVKCQLSVHVVHSGLFSSSWFDKTQLPDG